MHVSHSMAVECFQGVDHMTNVTPLNLWILFPSFSFKHVRYISLVYENSEVRERVFGL